MTDQVERRAEATASGGAQSAGDAGSETFERFRWQAKIALIAWLECLTSDIDGPTAVVCEYLEDIVICYPGHFVFSQLKTLDRGSWSDKRVCEDKGAIASLCRTHNEVQSRGTGLVARYSLRLEGAAAATKSTGSFFSDPKTADAAIRKKLISFGIERKQVDAFLDSLEISPNQPPRSHIDAVITQIIGALWPSMNQPDCANLFSRLLTCVEEAQEGTYVPTTSLSPTTIERLELLANEGSIVSLNGKVLTAEDLKARTPPLPQTSTEDLVRRAKENGVSALELKLRAAGAQERTVEKVLALRAAAELRRQEILASENGSERLETIDRPLLGFAEAVADQAALLAGSNTSIAARPADWIYNQLASNPHNLQAIDAERLFGGRHDHVLGYLGHLSDSCLYPWRSTL